MEKKVVAGRYRIERQIGEGGMGTVYEAYHVVSQRKVALKVLLPQIAKDESNRNRFLREASVAAKIGHEGIVEVYDAGFDDAGDGSPFVAMEFLEGSTLADRLESARMQLPEMFSIFLRMLEPLAAAHANGIVHRDLKPENVFLQRKPNGTEVVKILDFGIARDLNPQNQSMTQTGMAMGTPYYMAPEQAMSAKGVVASADVWSIGAMLYEVVTGTVPFDGETSSAVVVHVCTMPHRPTAEAAPGVPPALAQLIDRCLSKEPTHRPENASVLLATLRTLAEQLGIAIPHAIGVAPGGAPAGGPAAPTYGAHAGPSVSHPGFAPPVAASAGPSVSHPGFVPPVGAHAAHAAHTPAPAPGFMPATAVSGGFGAAPAYAAPAAAGFAQPPFATVPIAPGQPQQAWGAQSMPYPVPPTPAPSKSRTGLWLGLAGVGVLAIVGAGVGLYYAGEQAELATATSTTSPTQTPQTTAPATSVTAPAFANSPQRFTGMLAQGDRTLVSGEFMDDFEIPFQAGQRFRARLHAEKFDPYLIVRSPSGKSHDNDDVARHDRDSQLDIDVDESGTWRVVATSHAVGESGEYELTIEPRP